MILNLCQLIGGFILTLSAIPQIVRILRTKSAKDFSLISYLLTDLGIFLMELYAIGLAVNKAEYAFVITNSFALFTALVMTYLIIRYGRK
jgi:MtN3 and saliva related transmembrane protein